MPDGHEIDPSPVYPEFEYARLVFAMKTALFLFLLSFQGVYTEAEGRILQLYGKDFSFKVIEPEGWVLDTRSAPQIANFIFHPVGQDWRRAEAVIFARFIARSDETTLNGFLEENQTQFEEDCPFAEGDMPEFVSEKVNDFELRSYICPGFGNEIVAVKEVPRFFVLFSLNSSMNEGLKGGFPALKQILHSFQWIDTFPRNTIPPASKPGE